MESKLTDDVGPLAAAATSFPLLVYDYEHGDPPEISQTVLSVADGSMQTIQVPEMCCEYRCVETPQGLVLMVDASSGSCLLWNPQTGEKTALPSMNGEQQLPDSCRCLVSDITTFSPDDIGPADPLVLVYDLRRPELLFCRIRGGGAWVKESYNMGLYQVPGKAPTPRAIGEMAAVQGMFFYLDRRWLDVVGTLIVSPGDPEPHMEHATFTAPLPTLETDAKHKATRNYLLESSEKLFLVCLFYIGFTFERVEQVGVYVLDFSKDQLCWRKVTDIGNKAFLLGPRGFAASCSAAEHGLKSGCVYLADDPLGESNDYYIFDLKEGTRELVSPTLDIPALSGKPFWLVPVSVP